MIWRKIFVGFIFVKLHNNRNFKKNWTVELVLPHHKNPHFPAVVSNSAASFLKISTKYPTCSITAVQRRWQYFICENDKLRAQTLNNPAQKHKPTLASFRLHAQMVAVTSCLSLCSIFPGLPTTLTRLFRLSQWSLLSRPISTFYMSYICCFP